MSAITEHGGGVVINVKVVPRASKSEITGEVEGVIRIRLQAPPVDGKANKALILFLSDVLDVSRSAITILSGETGRNKRVAVAGLKIDQVQRLIQKV